MTCIIGLEHDGRVYMGGDSAMSDGYHIHYTPYPKVFRRGDYLVGWSSSFRMGQLLEHIWQPPPPPIPEQGLSGIAHMVHNIIPSLQACFKDGQFDWDDGLIQIGFQGELFIVYKDWQASRRTCGLTTTGSGFIIGEAAMMALEGLPPKERILRALEIAGKLHDSVGAPYYVMEL